MALLRSKQIKEFKPEIEWSSATASDIASAQSIRDEFLSDKQIVEQVINLTETIDSSNGTWSIPVLLPILDNNKKNVDVYINGVKTNDINSISNNGLLITLNKYDYNLDSTDKLEVKYLTDYLSTNLGVELAGTLATGLQQGQTFQFTLNGEPHSVTVQNISVGGVVTLLIQSEPIEFTLGGGGENKNTAKISFDNDKYNMSVTLDELNNGTANLTLSAIDEEPIRFDFGSTVSGTNGSTVSVSLYAYNYKGLTFQGTIKFDQTILSYQSAQFSQVFANSGSGNFGLTQTGQGNLMFLWISDDVLNNFTANGPMITIVFEIIGTTGQQSELNIVTTPTLIELVQINDEDDSLIIIPQIRDFITSGLVIVS